MDAVVKLLNISAEELNDALTVTITLTRGETIRRNYTQAQAYGMRACCVCLFVWLRVCLSCLLFVMLFRFCTCCDFPTSSCLVSFGPFPLEFHTHTHTHTHMPPGEQNFHVFQYLFACPEKDKYLLTKVEDFE